MNTVNPVAIAEASAEMVSLKDRYRESGYQLKQMIDAGVPNAQVVECLRTFHNDAVAYFDTSERSIGQADHFGGFRSAAWAVGFAETCAGVLEVIPQHYAAIRVLCQRESVDIEPFLPTIGSYTQMQRLVALYRPDLMPQLCDLLSAQGLSVIGSQDFIEVQSLNREQVIQKYGAMAFGVVFAVLLLAMATYIPNPSIYQQFVSRVILALAAGCVAAGFLPGFLRVRVSWGKRFALAAGGALAVFVVVYLINPPAVSERGTSGGESVLNPPLPSF